MVASHMPGITLYKNGRKLDVTDQNKYAYQKSSDSLLLMLYNPKEQDYGDYTIYLWSTTSRIEKWINVTLSEPLGR